MFSWNVGRNNSSFSAARCIDRDGFLNLGTRARLATSPRAPSTETMSWQSYVDDHLIGTGHVTKGAICGVDGALWAASAGFNVRLRAPPTPGTLDVAFIRWKPRSDARSLPPRVPRSQVSPEEVQKIVAGMDDPSALQAGGVYVGGEKYMFIQSDDRLVAAKKVRFACRVRRWTTHPSLGASANIAPTRPTTMPSPTRDDTQRKPSTRLSRVRETPPPLPPPSRPLTPPRPPTPTTQGSTGLFVCKAATCVVIGTHDENIQGGNCNTCVGNLADYLLNNGM